MIQYCLDHPDESYVSISKRFGVHDTTIGGWMKDYKKNDNEVIVRGSGNYSSDEAKEIARLQRELRDTKDALEVLKKQSVFWENDKNSLCCYICVYRRN